MLMQSPGNTAFFPTVMHRFLFPIQKRHRASLRNQSHPSTSAQGFPEAAYWGKNARSFAQFLGPVPGHVPADDRKRPSGNIAGPARRDGGVLHHPALRHHVGLLRGLPVFVPDRAEDDQLGRPCAGLRRAGLDDFGSADPLSRADRSDCVDRRTACLRVLHLRCLHYRPYFLEDYVVGARNFPMRRISGVFQILRTIDTKSKGVDANLKPKDLYNELVFRILN